MTQYITYRCSKCGGINGTTYPSQKDFTPSSLGQRDRDDPPISYVGKNLTMYVGLRRCKHCKAWAVIVFCGWYFQPCAFSYLPYETEYMGKIGLEVAQWCITGMVRKNGEVPRELKKWMEEVV